MTTHLLNSVMMSAEGNYRLRRVTAEAWAAEAAAALRAGTARSSIGYPDTARVLSARCGVEVPVSCALTNLEDGDVLLIAFMPWTPDPEKHADFFYFRAEYRAIPPAVEDLRARARLVPESLRSLRAHNPVVDHALRAYLAGSLSYEAALEEAVIVLVAQNEEHVRARTRHAEIARVAP